MSTNTPDDQTPPQAGPPGSPPPQAGPPGSPPPQGGSVPPAGGYPPPPPGGYATAPPSGQQYTQPPLSDSDQRLWATLAHAGGILIGFLAGLIVWLVQRERGRYVEEQSKEALNFQITLGIGQVVGWATTWLGIGFLIILAAYILQLVFGILAAIASNKGEAYRYPFALRLVK
ncbi:DUF4870 domain-containing protein [Cellulomonas bogoriensis]|uniref:DUF4870 domain-containing protein n=1 Tax=Cellulomonas bogoriensis 69B4 = DSM 16987 TaxID=1386082 RepID=A0A0A0BTH2_9CELL|nr:DUF4870 domain-containing protein [Cellulomonas bogoriensis]KGM11703.1 hypothetical protein N869_02575 [Cellulomonas bogoriensis 69B4 = DSM 16987]